MGVILMLTTMVFQVAPAVMISRRLLGRTSEHDQKPNPDKGGPEGLPTALSLPPEPGRVGSDHATEVTPVLPMKDDQEGQKAHSLHRVSHQFLDNDNVGSDSMDAVGDVALIRYQV